jgi:hypothetical protein
MRWGVGQKMSFFVHTQGIKTVHTGEGVKKWQNSVHIVVECPLISARLPRLQLSLAAVGRGSAPLVVVGNSVLLDCPNIQNSNDSFSQVNQ